MKLFFYALREYDEKGFLEECAAKYDFEYGYTSEYPNMDNLELARGFEGVAIITNPVDSKMLDKMQELGIRYLTTRSIGYEHIDIAYAKKIGIRVA